MCRPRRAPAAPAAVVLFALVLPPASPAADWSVLPVTEELRIESAAVSPVDPDRVFAWTGIGYRSTDGGDSWEQLRARHGARPLAALGDPVFDPVDAGTLWGVVNERPVRSTDFGETWADWGTAPPAPLEAFVPDPFTPAAAAWAIAGSGAVHGAYRTTDAGASWELASGSLGAVEVASLAPSPVDASVVLLGASTGVARTTDDGATWTTVYGGSAAGHVRWHAGGQHAAAVLSTPAQPLIRSSDAGATWELAPSVRLTGRETGLLDYEFDDLDPARLLLSSVEWCQHWSGAYGYAGSTQLTTDGGESWSRDYRVPCGANPHVWPPSGVDLGGDRAWTWFPLDTGRHGLQRSTDRGETWASLVNGIHESPCANLQVGPAGELWWQRVESRYNPPVLLRSTDAGSSWGEPDLQPWSWYDLVEGIVLEASRTRPDDLFAVTTWLDIGAIDAVWGLHFWRTTDAGSGWTPFSGDPETLAWATLNAAEDATVAYNHGSGQTIYVWLDRGSSDPLYRSDDGNETYEEIGDVGFYPVDAVISPANDLHVWAAVDEPEPVRLSTDGGLTWESRSAGLPDRTPARLLVDHTNRDHLVIVYQSGSPWESFDGGLGWRGFAAGPAPARAIPESAPVPETLGLRRVTVHDADWDVAGETRRLFLATSRGPWVSDLGFVTGLPIESVEEIAYSRVNQLLVVGSERHGVFGTDWPALSEGGEAHRANDPAAPIRLAVAPSPFARSSTVSFGLARPGPARVEVFDPAGRRVITLLDRTVEAGPHALPWSGRDSAGQSVAPGIYFVRLSTPAGTETRRAVRLR